MGQDAWYIMADRLCSGSPKNYAAKSAFREEDGRAKTATVESDSGYDNSRYSLAVLTTAEDDARLRTSSMEMDVFRFETTSDRHMEMDPQPGMSQRYQLHGSRPFDQPGHDEMCSIQTQDRSLRVPNIVVECTTTRDARGHRLTPPFVLPASSNWSLSSPVSSSRQIRALSDSSVYELERSPILNSSYIPSASSEFRHSHPYYAWKSLTDIGEKGEVRNVFADDASEVADLRTTPSLLRDLRKSKTSRLSAVIEPDQDDAEVYENKQTDPPTVPFRWHSHSHQTRLSQRKSPKTDWMRRHSDSNLINRQGSSLLRLEPYPIRSRSTGDSIPASATVIPQASQSAEKLEMPGSEKEVMDTRIQTLSMTERPPPSEEKSAGLYEKRLKLKKYLQTRYQTSLLEMRQSGDADDVFTDRSLDPGSPGLPVPSASDIHISVPQSSPKPVQDESDFEMPEKVFCYDREMPGRNVSGEGEYSYDDYSDISDRRAFNEGPQKGMKDVADVSSHATAVHASETSVFVFPVVSTTHVSDPVVSPSWWRQHVAQDQVPPGSLFPRSETTDSPASARAHSETHKRKSTGDSPHRSLGEERYHQPLVVSKHPEMLAAYSHFPLLVDSPAEKPSRRAHLRCSPWEVSDQRNPTSALTRPQSYSSLLNFSAISEQPSFPLARFPSSPALSDCPAASASLVSGWRETGDASPRLVSSPSVARASTSSDRSLVMRHSYSPMHESGPDRYESATARSKFTCPLCNQEFVSYSHLTNHMSSHLLPESASKESATEGLKVHLCRVCNRAFSRSDMLTRHTRLHTGLRPYECHLCGQVFSRSDHLHTHLRTHTGEKPYKCTNCPYAAPRRDMVTRHMRIHARDAPHRGRRSASVSSDVPASPLYADLGSLSSEDVCRRIQSLSSVEPMRTERLRSHDSSTNASTDAAEDADLGVVHQVISCRTCSLTSSESTEGSDVSHVCPPGASHHTWSSTSGESFESYSSPRIRERLSWSSSAESPDVFCRAPQQFFWSVRAAGHRPEKHQQQQQHDGASTSAVDIMSIEMQSSFERCTVTTPEQDSHEATGEGSRPTEIYGTEKVKIEEETTFDRDKD